MLLIRSFVIAFSTYSRIPMPRFKWKKEDMAYSLAFFPWIGAVIGLLLYFWLGFAKRLELGVPATVLVGAAIPLIITGGFHLDGFMDTMDAVRSFREKEVKLSIMKDPHVGAFAIISLLLYYILYIAFLSELKTDRQVMIVAVGFVLSRTLSGLSLVFFKPARAEGMLYEEATNTRKDDVKYWLFLTLLICAVAMIGFNILAGLAAFIAALLWTLIYKRFCLREFGGITGDTSGYFVTMTEMVVLITVVICGFIKLKI